MASPILGKAGPSSRRQAIREIALAAGAADRMTGPLFGGGQPEKGSFPYSAGSMVVDST